MFERHHDHRGQCGRSVVVKSCDPCFFLGMGIMVEALKQAGTWHVSSELLKMSVNTGDS